MSGMSFGFGRGIRLVYLRMIERERKRVSLTLSDTQRGKRERE